MGWGVVKNVDKTPTSNTEYIVKIVFTQIVQKLFPILSIGGSKIRP